MLCAQRSDPSWVGRREKSLRGGACIISLIRVMSYLGAGSLLALAPAALFLLVEAIASPGLEGRWGLCARQVAFLIVAATIALTLLRSAPRRTLAAGAMLASAVFSAVGLFAFWVWQPAAAEWGPVQRLEATLKQSIGGPLDPPKSNLRIVRIDATEVRIAPRSSGLALLLGDDPLQFDRVVVKTDDRGFVSEVYVDYF